MSLFDDTASDLVSVSDNDQPRSFFSNGGNMRSGNAKNMWIAVYTMLLLWMVNLLLLYLVAKKPSPARWSTVDRDFTAPEGDKNARVSRTNYDRYVQGSRTAQLGFLLLLSSVLISVLGHGASGGTEVLQWIVMALFILWTLAEWVVDSHWLRLAMALLTFPLVAINFGLAFRHGTSND
ncbi:hypothetical protein BC828DRAFT_394216 [Blastocladiella britannica]|nr:hypothetical protein BC828DRAFT_394216 [Blastocladiella britannica]